MVFPLRMTSLTSCGVTLRTKWSLSLRLFWSCGKPMALCSHLPPLIRYYTIWVACAASLYENMHDGNA